MRIKGITLLNPWAALVALGLKKIETRGYGTPYRGLLAIHASLSVPDEARDRLGLRAFRRALAPIGITRDEDLERLPRGVVVAVAKLVDVVATDGDDPRLPDVGSDEWVFGNYAPGRKAWILEDLMRLQTPIPCSGALSIWDCEIDLAAGTARRLGRADRNG